MSCTLTVPGRHEARALACRCDTCGAVIHAAAVLDREDRTREAGYSCPCGNRWVRCWGAP